AAAACHWTCAHCVTRTTGWASVVLAHAACSAARRVVVPGPEHEPPPDLRPRCPAIRPPTTVSGRSPPRSDSQMPAAGPAGGGADAWKERPSPWDELWPTIVTLAGAGLLVRIAELVYRTIRKIVRHLGRRAERKLAQARERSAQTGEDAQPSTAEG